MLLCKFTLRQLKQARVQDCYMLPTRFEPTLDALDPTIILLQFRASSVEAGHARGVVT